MKPMLVFPGGEAQKAELISALVEQGPIIREEDFERIGVPFSFGCLARDISNGLPTLRAAAWLKRLYAALPVGIDLRPIHHRLIVWSLVDPTHGVICSANMSGQPAIQSVAELHLRSARDDYPTTEEWDNATEAAAAAWIAAKAAKATKTTTAEAAAATAVATAAAKAIWTAWIAARATKDAENIVTKFAETAAEAAWVGYAKAVWTADAVVSAAKAAETNFAKASQNAAVKAIVVKSSWELVKAAKVVKAIDAAKAATAATAKAVKTDSTAVWFAAQVTKTAALAAAYRKLADRLIIEVKQEELRQRK